MARKQLVGELSIQEIVGRLAFAEEETQQAALEQPKLYMAAATFRIHKMRARQEAEMALENLCVDRSLYLRRQQKVGEKKKGLTEKNIADLVENMKEVRELKAKLATAKRMEEWSKLLLDAYEHRRSTLKILVQFAFIQDTVGGRHEVDKLHAQREKLRDQLHRDRAFVDGEMD